MEWTYKNEPLTPELVEKYLGFIYVVTNLIDGRKYIGKKLLRFQKTKTVKGKTKKILVESDYLKYYGSSEEVKADVKRLGEENFKREILHFCTTKAEMSWLELVEQVENKVLLRPKEYYNAYVGARINRSHLKHIMEQ